MPARWLNPFKPWLVPVWNGAHQAWWSVSEHAEAVFTGRFERCTVCGKHALMLRRPRAVTPRLVELWGLSRRQAAALIRKETLLCRACGAPLRARRIAYVILEVYRDPGARSLREWTDTPRARGLVIAEINLIPGVHQELERLERLSASDYADPDTHAFGPLPSENLEALSYPDSTFDLVLTSETLEHVPDLSAALHEVYRVLKPGGFHIFTVPLLPHVEFTFRRTPLPEGRELVPPTRLSAHEAQLSNDQHITIRHPGGDWGYLVHTEFGRDFADILRQAGFETEMRFGPPSDDDLAQVWICRKPHS